jgi:predicted transglutaminase-like cysteine proteinase
MRVEESDAKTYSTNWFVNHNLSILGACNLYRIHKRVRLAISEWLDVLDRFVFVSKLRGNHLDVLYIITKRGKLLLRVHSSARDVPISSFTYFQFCLLSENYKFLLFLREASFLIDFH